MKAKSLFQSTGLLVGVQMLVTGVAIGALAMTPGKALRQAEQLLISNAMPVEITLERTTPLRITPFYDRPEMVSDEELAAVLEKILPRFSHVQTKPNFVEHALRVWSVDATFQQAGTISGAHMMDYLINHASYIQAWNQRQVSLLEDRPSGVGVKWGRDVGASVHHDHMLACLSEAGISLDQEVVTPSLRKTEFREVLIEAIRDFQLDERETEWTVMGFGLWLPPQKTWIAANGREMSFDILAHRLLRGKLETGVCSGTHRVYSLAVLLRLDEDYDILSDETHTLIYRHLEYVRELITQSQFEDGHWPSNWDQGKLAVDSPRDDGLKEKVIATGHHLEWLSIAPEELHPPREMIEKAARWCVDNTVSRTDEEIAAMYTFYSHVGNALCNWRMKRPSDFWREWEQDHPVKETADAQ